MRRATRTLISVVGALAVVGGVAVALSGPAGDGTSSVRLRSEAVEPEPTDIESTADSEAADEAGAESEPEKESEAEPETESEPETQPDERALPNDPAEMVAAINEAERAVRDPALDAATLDRWGRRQQALYRHLSFNPEWVDETLIGVDPDVADAVSLNWRARQSLSSLVDTETLHAELPAWRVVDPRPADELIGYYKAAEAEHGIEWEFLAAINLIETRMGRIEGISTAGAVGPMQFLPTTWAECCQGDPTDPADAIPGAARYLVVRGGPDNMERAIWGYNNSDYYVEAVTSYAEVMMADERAYYGYHGWEIYFRSTEGLIRIPVGYEQTEPISAVDWLADNPETLFEP